MRVPRTKPTIPPEVAVRSRLRALLADVLAGKWPGRKERKERQEDEDEFVSQGVLSAPDTWRDL
jgi:hypothetical protein